MFYSQKFKIQRNKLLISSTYLSYLFKNKQTDPSHQRVLKIVYGVEEVKEQNITEQSQKELKTKQVNA